MASRPRTGPFGVAHCERPDQSRLSHTAPLGRRLAPGGRASRFEPADRRPQLGHSLNGRPQANLEHFQDKVIALTDVVRIEHVGDLGERNRMTTKFSDPQKPTPVRVIEMARIGPSAPRLNQAELLIEANGAWREPRKRGRVAHAEGRRPIPRGRRASVSTGSVARLIGAIGGRPPFSPAAMPRHVSLRHDAAPGGHVVDDMSVKRRLSKSGGGGLVQPASPSAPR